MDKAVVKAMLSYEYDRLGYLVYQEFEELADMFTFQANRSYDSLNDEERAVLAEIRACRSKATNSLDELRDKVYAAMELFDETE